MAARRGVASAASASDIPCRHLAPDERVAAPFVCGSERRHPSCSEERRTSQEFAALEDPPGRGGRGATLFFARERLRDPCFPARDPNSAGELDRSRSAGGVRECRGRALRRRLQRRVHAIFQTDVSIPIGASTWDRRGGGGRMQTNSFGGTSPPRLMAGSPPRHPVTRTGAGRGEGLLDQRRQDHGGIRTNDTARLGLGASTPKGGFES